MRALPLLLLACTAAASPREFEVTVTPKQGPEALAHLADLRCGGKAERVGEPGDGGLSGTFTCPEHPGTDLTDVLASAEFVVRGKVTALEKVDPPRHADPGAGWRRATLSVERVLKGRAKVATVSFLFIGSTDEAYGDAPKPRVGQDGVWLLQRGEGALRELTVLDGLNAQPPAAESLVSALLAEKPCPAKPAGTCEAMGSVCFSAGTTCRCEAACRGGHKPPPGSVPTPSWVCRPSACSDVRAGAPCEPNGLSCVGCWGVASWTCEGGRWRQHRISPPP